LEVPDRWQEGRSASRGVSGFNGNSGTTDFSRAAGSWQHFPLQNAAAWARPAVAIKNTSINDSHLNVGFRIFMGALCIMTTSDIRLQKL
jgi:hypothetical protein